MEVWPAMGVDEKAGSPKGTGSDTNSQPSATEEVKWRESSFQVIVGDILNIHGFFMPSIWLCLGVSGMLRCISRILMKRVKSWRKLRKKIIPSPISTIKQKNVHTICDILLAYMPEHCNMSSDIFPLHSKAEKPKTLQKNRGAHQLEPNTIKIDLTSLLKEAGPLIC